MATQSGPFLLMNGHLYPADAAVIRAGDAGFLHAHGAFETLRTQAGRVVGWRRHHARLSATLVALGIRVELHGMRAQIESLVQRNRVEREGRVRVTVTAGVEGRPTVLIQAESLPERIHAKRRGVRVRVLSMPRGTPAYKTLDWLGPRLALAQVAIDEEPLRCVDGQVLEGATSNIFCATPTGVITPPTDGRILPGTARAVLVEVLTRLSIPCREQPLSLVTLMQYGGVVTNALLRFAPILAVEGQGTSVPDWVEAAGGVFDAVAG